VEQELTERVTHLVLQIAVILFAAKLAGEVCERWLRVPPVLGELVAGVIIGPFALGGMISLGPLGPLFPRPHEGTGNPLEAISPELWAVAQLASIVLLFATGLETQVGLFLRYVGPATPVALGGLVLPFSLGAVLTVAFGFAGGLSTPEALFIGASMTATSVGITARVLQDIHRLNSPEGVTILAAAVLDDVLGILVLTIVVAISERGTVSPGEALLVLVKAVGFWLLLTGGGLLLSRRISRWFSAFRSAGAGLVLALGLGFLGAGLAETVGLAMIIGAYSVGLALSATPLAERIREPLEGVYHALVPIFFVVMGMLVDLTALGGVLLFGAVLSVAAILTKVLGCGLPAMGVGFNPLGATRVGLGMMPRGEVALIVAGVGLARGVIHGDLFAVTVMMTAVTTLLAPILLVWAFRNGRPGLRRAEAPRQAVE